MICNENNMNVTCPNSKTEFCSCLHLIEVDLNDLVEFIFVDEIYTTFEINVETIHPIHLHGYSYAIVAMDKVRKSKMFSVFDFYSNF
jgi:L-ascorbate oxidase